ncbi:hypothetical protein HDU97_000013 [Phlyctochytrium planicorne]|nr:hypothetical protein HDU97_000013 [Phlyctochytrium planicorne]
MTSTCSSFRQRSGHNPSLPSISHIRTISVISKRSASADPEAREESPETTVTKATGRGRKRAKRRLVEENYLVDPELEAPVHVPDETQAIDYRKTAKQRVDSLYADISEEEDRMPNRTETTSDKKGDKEDDWFVGSAYNTPAVGEERSGSTEFVPTWMKVQRRADARRTTGEDADDDEISSEGRLTVADVVKLIEAERGQKMAVMDVSTKCDWTETMIVVEGRSKKQLFSIVDGVRRMAKKFSETDPTVPGSLAIEGATCDDWMVLDLGRVIVHAMTPEARKRYDIEGLWKSLPEESEQFGSTSFKVTEAEDDQKMLDIVERAWAGRPLSVVKTKQIEAEDMMEEEEMISRIRGGEVIRRRRRSN